MDTTSKNMDSPHGHGNQNPKPDRKIRVGWFSFSCCEDSTIVMTEVMNDHWQAWKQIIDFRHARVLQSKNTLDDLDIAFVEGAIASPLHEARLKAIRVKSRKLVAVGACAIQGLPAGQRNSFSDTQKQQIEFLLARFAALPKVLRVSDVVKVDAELPGCPMNPKDFLEKLKNLITEIQFDIPKREPVVF